MFLTVWPGIAQHQRVIRIFKQTDTCIALQIMHQTLPFSVSEAGFLYLMDDFKCIEAEMITLNPYQNKIYLPNGAHSNISVVDFEADEPLLLKPYDGESGESFTWLSFPRLRTSNPTVNEVLGGDNIEPNTYQRDDSKLKNKPLGSNGVIENIYNGTEWPSLEQDLTHINATLGYKLTLKYGSDPNQNIKLFLHGSVIDPATTIPQLYKDKENWVGYWLYQTQNIFDALGSTADHLTSIKHQDWTCLYTEWPPFGPGSTPPGTGPKWYCDSKNRNIRYGDMVILSGDENIYNFQWNINGMPPEVREESAPEHYSYEEQPDYTPVMVLLDSSDNPQEIGVFENDSCIGANTVATGDSAVVIRSYMTGNSTDSLTFEMYYGSKSIQRKQVPDYYVRTDGQYFFEKRKISAGEKAAFFVVSFRKPENLKPEETGIEALQIWPNPAANNLNIGFTLSKPGFVTIEIINMEGKTVARPVNSHMQPGKHTLSLTLQDAGQKLIKGLYLIKVTCNGKPALKKVVVE